MSSILMTEDRCNAIMDPLHESNAFRGDRILLFIHMTECLITETTEWISIKFINGGRGGGLVYTETCRYNGRVMRVILKRIWQK
jgi:hypothetical protein